MSEIPTPETDAYCLRAIGFPTGYEWREFARKLERQRDDARELARELRYALKELADNGHTEECDALNYANKHCDCGVDSARMLISKAKEVLP